jgi:hypothetical protein
MPLAEETTTGRDAVGVDETDRRMSERREGFTATAATADAPAPRKSRLEMVNVSPVEKPFAQAAGFLRSAGSRQRKRC